jgi:hypothetical protein
VKRWYSSRDVSAEQVTFNMPRHDIRRAVSGHLSWHATTTTTWHK